MGCASLSPGSDGLLHIMQTSSPILNCCTIDTNELMVFRPCKHYSTAEAIAVSFDVTDNFSGANVSVRKIAHNLKFYVLKTGKMSNLDKIYFFLA